MPVPQWEVDNWIESCHHVYWQGCEEWSVFSAAPDWIHRATIQKMRQVIFFIMTKWLIEYNDLEKWQFPRLLFVIFLAWMWARLVANEVFFGFYDGMQWYSVLTSLLMVCNDAVYWHLYWWYAMMQYTDIFTDGMQWCSVLTSLLLVCNDAVYWHLYWWWCIRWIL